MIPYVDLPDGDVFGKPRASGDDPSGQRIPALFNL